MTASVKDEMYFMNILPDEEYQLFAPIGAILPIMGGKAP